MKGSKMIQGKGEFHKVSGSKPPKKVGPKPTDCRVCGSCEPSDLGRVYPVATTPIEKYVSEWTGKTIITLRQDSG